MPIGHYCDATFGDGGLSGQQAILIAHLVYVAGAGYWLGRSSRVPGEGRGHGEGHLQNRPAWVIPLATLLYTLCSMLWHLTGNPHFAAGDGALSIVFLVLVAEWRTREDVTLLRWLRALAPAIAYVPLYHWLGAPAYLAAMAAAGAVVLRNALLLGDRHVWRSCGAALVAITLAFAFWLLDGPLCGLTGFFTGHALDHFFDGWCFFFLMKAMIDTRR